MMKRVAAVRMPFLIVTGSFLIVTVPVAESSEYNEELIQKELSGNLKRNLRVLSQRNCWVKILMIYLLRRKNQYRRQLNLQILKYKILSIWMK
jgi:hypothetical protein